MNWSEILYYSYRISRWKFGDKSPILASVKLTYKCNLSCIHCGWKNLTVSAEIDYNQWSDIFYKLYHIGVRILVLEGGEPTLRKDLSLIINKAKDIGFRVVLVTNGTNSLKYFSPDLVMCSIDGPKKIHEKIRGKNSYKNLLHNLKQCSSRKMALTTINRENVLYIKETLLEYEPYVDLFGFNIMYSIKESTKTMTLTEKETEYIYRTILSYSKEFNIVNTENMINSIYWKCTPWILIVCEPDGSWTHQKTCFVDYIVKEHDCAACQLACYRGLSLLARGDINTWYLVNNYLFNH